MTNKYMKRDPRSYFIKELKSKMIGTSLGFPGSSAGKESACSDGDPISITGLGRSTGEGISYPLQHSWVSLVAQRVQNMPAMQETMGSFLGLGRSQGEGNSYLVQYSGWRILYTKESGRL